MTVVKCCECIVVLVVCGVWLLVVVLFVECCVWCVGALCGCVNFVACSCVHFCHDYVYE